MKKQIMLLFITFLYSLSFAQMDIFSAAKEGSVNDVQLSLASGQDVNARDNYGQTPLMYAAGSNTEEVIRALISAGADINAVTPTNWNASHYAARDNSNPNALLALIDAGIDMSLLNSDELMPSELARDLNPIVSKELDSYFDSRLGDKPLLGDNYSFYASPFCQIYACKFIKSTEDASKVIHEYVLETKLPITIVTVREHKDKGFKVNEVSLVQETDYTTDNRVSQYTAKVSSDLLKMATGSTHGLDIFNECVFENGFTSIGIENLFAFTKNLVKSEGYVSDCTVIEHAYGHNGGWYFSVLDTMVRPDKLSQVSTLVMRQKKDVNTYEDQTVDSRPSTIIPASLEGDWKSDDGIVVRISTSNSQRWLHFLAPNSQNPAGSCRLISMDSGALSCMVYPTGPGPSFEMFGYTRENKLIMIDLYQNVRSFWWVE